MLRVKLRLESGLDRRRAQRFRASAPAHHVLAAVVLAVVLAGCAGVRVTTDFDPSADFSKLSSYRWLPQERDPSGDPRLDNTLLDARIRRAVDSELAARGYERRSEDPVDFLVAYHTAIERRLDVNVVNDYYGPGWGYWNAGSSYTTVTDYEEGSILLDVLDPASRRLIWRGVAQAELLHDATPEEREARVARAVAAMLEKFPPE